MKTITLDQLPAMDRIKDILNALRGPHQAGEMTRIIEEAAESLRGMFLEAEKIGATGKYPHGKMTPNDLGGLKAALVKRGDRLVLDFGKELQWISMTKNEAMVFGGGVIRMAQSM